MNYAGKFDAAISLDGGGSHSPADVHADSFTGKPFIAKAHGHVPQGAFVVPDPNLIFNGEFKRAGGDLVLSHDGHEFVVHDYFRGDKRAALAAMETEEEDAKSQRDGVSNGGGCGLTSGVG